MKAVILAGGFATRLWPLTKEQAKPLVDIAGRPIIAYILEKIMKSEHITDVIISTNAKFRDDFEKWLDKEKFQKPIKIITENAAREEEKLGAIGGLNFVFSKEDIKEGVLAVGGDNLIGIDIDSMIASFNKKGSPIVAVYDIKDLEQVKNRFGEVFRDENEKLIRFREKPEKPESTLISTCCYIFPKDIKKWVAEYINGKNNKDAPGFFIDWLSKKTDVFTYIFDKYWFDIGDHQTLEKAREFTARNRHLL
jgi:glucose-1-phosphate thymidylyltransferase